MNTTQTTRTEQYRYLGSTDDVLRCDHCGRIDLTHTVVLELLDADGNVEEVVYFGSTCAARSGAEASTSISQPCPRPRRCHSVSLTCASTGEATGFPRRTTVPSGRRTTSPVTSVRSGPACTWPPANATQAAASSKAWAWPHYHESGKPSLPQFFSP